MRADRCEKLVGRLCWRCRADGRHLHHGVIICPIVYRSFAVVLRPAGSAWRRRRVEGVGHIYTASWTRVVVDRARTRTGGDGHLADAETALR